MMNMDVDARQPRPGIPPDVDSLARLFTDLALQELGRIEPTLFMLEWLVSLELRQRCQAGLNKNEQRRSGH